MLLVHEAQDVVVARLDAEVHARAACAPHLARQSLVDGIDPRQALPGEAQSAAADLGADRDDPLALEGEHVVGERDAVVAQREGLLDLVDHADRRACAVRVAKDDVAAELAGEGAAARAHDGRDRGSVAAPAVADVGGIGEEVAGGEGQPVEVGREGARRGGPRRRRVAGAGGAGRHDARDRADVRARLVRGEELDHGRFALAAHDRVEVPEERLGLARRQRASGDEQAAAPAQALGEPETVVEHRRHAGDADDLGVRRQRHAQRLVAAQEGAVQEPHVVTRLPRRGGDVRRSQRREAEPRPVDRPPDERIDDQDGGHGVLSMVSS